MLTTGEVAKLFQVSAQTVINWLDQGRMPFERIGRGPRRLTESNVLNYIKEIGISLFGPNLLLVEISALLLLTALIGAFHIGRRHQESSQ